ncbi:MAG: 3-oxoacyl-ACP reductase FabG [Alphaproteobacteria bacterium]
MRKNVLITGASRGIGKVICEELIKNYNLLVVGRNKKSLEDLFKNNEHVLERFECDLENLGEISSMAEEIIKKKIPIDILINNAGMTDDSLFIRMNYEKWQKVINTNLNSNFHLTNLISKIMMKQKWGRIINITSIVGHTGNLGQANYAASKAGIIGMSKSIAAELAKWNITVNCISPGFIETDMTESMSEDQKKIVISKIPSRKIGKPIDIANCVKFLASEGSSYITGETIHVNGGMLML